MEWFCTLETNPIGSQQWRRAVSQVALPSSVLLVSESCIAPLAFKKTNNVSSTTGYQYFWLYEENKHRSVPTPSWIAVYLSKHCIWAQQYPTNEDYQNVSHQPADHQSRNFCLAGVCMVPGEAMLLPGCIWQYLASLLACQLMLLTALLQPWEASGMSPLRIRPIRLFWPPFHYSLR